MKVGNNNARAEILQNLHFGNSFTTEAGALVSVYMDLRKWPAWKSMYSLVNSWAILLA